MGKHPHILSPPTVQSAAAHFVTSEFSLLILLHVQIRVLLLIPRWVNKASVAHPWCELAHMHRTDWWWEPMIKRVARSTNVYSSQFWLFPRVLRERAWISHFSLQFLPSCRCRGVSEHWRKKDEAAHWCTPLENFWCAIRGWGVDCHSEFFLLLFYILHLWCKMVTLTKLIVHSSRISLVAHKNSGKAHTQEMRCTISSKAKGTP